MWFRWVFPHWCVTAVSPQCSSDSPSLHTVPPSAVSSTSVTVFDTGTPGLFAGEMTEGNEGGIGKFTKLEIIEVEFLFSSLRNTHYCNKYKKYNLNLLTVLVIALYNLEITSLRSSSTCFCRGGKRIKGELSAVIVDKSMDGLCVHAL